MQIEKTLPWVSRVWRSLLVSSLALSPAALQADCYEDAMLVFDGSGSMAEMGFNLIDEPRIFEARTAVGRVLPAVAPSRRIGLVVYGPSLPQAPDQCSGIDLRFGPRVDAAKDVMDAIDALQPEGETALTAAVQLAAETLSYTSKPGTVVLVTDGKETCGGQTCALAKELRRNGASLTVHVIGFKVRGQHFGWPTQTDSDYLNSESVARCLADETGGEYVSAETVDDLIAAMMRTLGCNFLF